MQRRATFWLLGMGVFAAAVLVFNGSHVQAQREPAAAKSFKAVTSVEQLMEGQDLLFGRIRKAITGSKWEEGVVQTWVLAELANVNAQQTERPKYAAYAEAMKEKCIALAHALKKHDADAAKTAASEVNTSCKNCHDEFKKKRHRR